MNYCCTIADLQCKEVINLCDGARLGYICDIEVDTCTGKVVSVIVPGPWSISSFFSKGDEYVIPWECIEKIGDDIVLVKHELPPFPHNKDKEPRKRGKRKFL